MSDPDLRKQLLARISATPDFSHLESSLGALEFVLANNCLLVTFPHPFYAAFFQSHLLDDFRKLVHLTFGPEVEIGCETSSPDLACQPLPDMAEPEDAFAGFMENAKNSAALTAAKKLCSLQEEGFGLVIFSGPSGSGKTFLLNAIASTIARLHGSSALCLYRAAAFETSENPERFWSGHHALLLDDLQEIASHGAAQRLLASFLDAAFLTSSWRRIVLTLNDADLSAFVPRLARRLEQGLLLELPAPDLALRLAFTEMTSKKMGLRLSKAQIMALARHSTRIPAIQGLLQKLKFYDSFTGQTLSPEELEKLALPENMAPGWQRIILRVAEKLEIRPSDLMSQSRRREFVRARQVAMFLCRSRLGLSYPELGRIFGGKDHSTVMHGIRKIQQLRNVDRVLHIMLTELEEEHD